ncbi:YihY/virulence factor BrkB family protein [Salinirubellus salinus]|uniref:YihY/virulence factor BrkB family protein n=1 Tax=Salinirubellus salinus TaxID=1364945 RepID=A0A9E7R8U8_9EURY|nr:YihY/virulence factor BrkB family protein [Salinirubellus salinus]UWM56695.1 YihY/virulence factor BrkB family protein [Salinirubellus salinus]
MNFRQGAGRARAVLHAVFREVRSENVTFMAGSIAYHAFLSLLPFLLLVLFVVSRLGDEELARTLVNAMAGYLSPETVDVLVDAALNATGDGRLSVVGVVVLVWGALRIFRGLDTAFSDIYESEHENTFLDQVRDGVVVFGAIGLALFLVSLADALVAVPSFGPADAVVRPSLSMLTLTVAFLPMYYIFPDEVVSVREVVPGALVAATGWTALSLGFQFYVGATSTASYGIVGAVILLITWLYFGGLVLLVGAAVNAVLAGRSEDVAGIAWDAAPEPSGEGDPTADDAAFVAGVEELQAAFDTKPGTVRFVVGDTDVTVEAPDEVAFDVDTIDRPDLLGGDRETATVTMRWDSWKD